MKTRRIMPVRASAFLVFIAVTTMSLPSFAKEDARLGALKAAELARFAANDSADAGELEKLLDDDLEYVHSNGHVDTKRAFIDALKSGQRDYDSSRPNIDGIRILGDVAIIRGRALVKVSDHGGWLELDLGYTDVWVWKDGRWQMTAWRSARMPPPVAPVPAPAPARPQ